jgi:hypothetical protein
MSKRVLLVIPLLVLIVASAYYYSSIKNPKPFMSQTQCEQKTGKRCALFQGLCQVMVAKNQTEKEMNEKFLRDCENKIGTWQPID